MHPVSFLLLVESPPTGNEARRAFLVTPRDASASISHISSSDPHMGLVSPWATIRIHRDASKGAETKGAGAFPPENAEAGPLEC